MQPPKSAAIGGWSRWAKECIGRTSTRTSVSRRSLPDGPRPRVRPPCSAGFRRAKHKTEPMAKIVSKSPAEAHRTIHVRGAREHNLKNVDLEIPRDALIVFTGDRKSTRLNSSHGSISYAVFCLKKKK